MEKYDINELLEIRLTDDSNFLKVKETLTRIGIASFKSKKLYQTAHILHKKGKYYITHFKEMFKLDGRESDFDAEDKARRNKIASLLQDWGLVEIVDPAKAKDQVSMNNIKVLSHKEKSEWQCISKYSIGRKHFYKD